MGSVLYARKVLSILDPQNKYFGVGSSKILCRPEGGALYEKSLRHTFSDTSEWEHALIIDDQENAWDAGSRKHVLQIIPYHFFGRSQAGGAMTLMRIGTSTCITTQD